MGINIRQLKDDEYPEMLKLMYRVFPKANVKLSDRDSIIVADMQGEVVGFVHYASYHRKAVIKGFGVEGNARGIGIGTNLINQVLQRFEKIGKPVYLKVKQLNPAVNIYAKFGFTMAKIEEEKGTYMLVRRLNN